MMSKLKFVMEKQAALFHMRKVMEAFERIPERSIQTTAIASN